MSIDFHLDNGVALVTINRPERLNAMDAEHYRLLSEAWIRIRDDNEIRVAVITGSGDRSILRRGRSEELPSAGRRAWPSSC